MLEEIIRKRKIKKMRGAMKTELRKEIREGNAAKTEAWGKRIIKAGMHTERVRFYGLV